MKQFADFQGQDGLHLALMASYYRALMLNPDFFAALRVIYSDVGCQGTTKSEFTITQCSHGTGEEAKALHSSHKVGRLVQKWSKVV